MIKISKIDEEIFEVTVTKDSTTIHRINLSLEVYKKISDSKISKIELIKNTTLTHLELRTFGPGPTLLQIWSNFHNEQYAC